LQGLGTCRERRTAVSVFPTKILLATDGSKDAELAATTAADLANSTNSELHLATVAGGRAYTQASEEVEDLKQEAQKVVEEQKKKVEEAGGKVADTHVRVVSAHRAQAIVEVAEELGCGLIVMGSRGLGGIRRALMGSVSDTVVRHAHCPVLIVRH
jgi:nucleotide-binding universal stress UspA family protein